MKRRDFAKELAALGLSALVPSVSFAFQSAVSNPADPAVKRVLVMFKCHLDVGFIDTQANIVDKYFSQFYPLAIQTSAQMRQSGEDRYVWTTGSWLLYRYLETADTAARQRMERAITSGDIAWHALPFTWQTELMDHSLIAGGIGLSQALDRRFDRHTSGAKMTDVPGHTRGIIAPLIEQGVRFLDIGVNSASTPADVPDLFLWQNPAGQALAVMYHRTEYGGVVAIPGSDLAVAIEVKDDNLGPHTIEEIRQIYSSLRRQFPNAIVTAASLTDIANAVEPYRHHFPRVTAEIGDTWIYGIPSDPLKVARYRELARLRSEWIAQKKLAVGDAADVAFLSRFLLEVEHTWGTDTKTWLDFDHYTPHDLAQMLDTPPYKTVTSSWTEKRNDLFEAIAMLPAPLRDQATQRVQALKAVAPSVDGLNPHAAGQAIETEHFRIALDPETGAISQLQSKKTGRNWASPTELLAQFSYQTLSKDVYDRFFVSYLKSTEDWAPKDFGKPNIERFGARNQTWLPKLAEAWAGKNPAGDRLVAHLKISDPESERSGVVAWPARMYLEVRLPTAEPVVEIDFYWFGKTPNRMPEALWLSFQPVAADPRNWLLDKSGDQVSPFDVVAGGNRTMHAISPAVRYKDSKHRFAIETLDAPVVSLGEKSPVYFSREQPSLQKGFHFSLFNNGWGTNYIQWFGEDMRFRFRILC